MGRVDRYYLKRFEDETEMRTFLLLDSSASMGYGRQGPTKLAYASYLAAALAYLLAQQGDPAALLVFDAATRQYLPPRTRGGHIRDLLVALEAVYPAGRTEPGRALAYVGELADRRSLIVVFTDLLDAPANLADRLRQLRSRGHDVALFQILDPDEVELPFDEVTDFEAMEPDDGRRLLVDPRDLAASFARESAALRGAGRASAWSRASSTCSRRPPSRRRRSCAPFSSRASGRGDSACTSSRRRCCSACWPRSCPPSSTGSDGGRRARSASRRWSS